MLSTISIRLKVTAASLLVAVLFGVLCSSAIVATGNNRLHLFQISSSYSSVGTVALPLTRTALLMQVEVTQVQQHLQDISATRGRDGLDGGFRQADRSAAAFREQFLSLQGLMSSIRNDRIEAALRTVANRFDPFYSVGVKMAEAYVAEGPSAGNPLMREFDEHADALRQALGVIVEAVDELTRTFDARTNAAIGTLAASNASQLIITLLLSLLAFLMTGAIAWTMRRAVSEPIQSLADTMKVIAAGDLSHAIPLASCGNEIGEMARAVEVFRRDAADRTRLAREAQLLSEFNDWLQSAKSEAELYDMIADVLGRLIPGSSGSLYIYANSRDVLDCAKSWNGAKAGAAMHPDDCWGLRRGRTYVRAKGVKEIQFSCGHAHGTDSETCCIPILAHGETVGLLHLERAAANGGSDFAEERRLGIACAEQISLAIANIKLREQLHDQSIRDPLTGLYNRRYLLDTCRREFARAKRNEQSVSLLSLDVDHFKKFNDNHGHDAGDAVLRVLGECLKSIFREEDVACRFGGEEFVILLPGCDLGSASLRAEDLRRRVEQLAVRYADGTLPRITVSIGIAAFPVAGDTPPSVLKAADDALYRAKEQGRNCVVVCESHRLTPMSRIEAQGSPMAA